MAYFIPASSSSSYSNYSNLYNNASQMDDPSCTINETCECNNGSICLNNPLYENRQLIDNIKHLYSNDLGSGEIYEDTKRIYYQKYLNVVNIGIGTIVVFFYLIRLGSSVASPASSA